MACRPTGPKPTSFGELPDEIVTGHIVSCFAGDIAGLDVVRQVSRAFRRGTARARNTREHTTALLKSAYKFCEANTTMDHSETCTRKAGEYARRQIEAFAKNASTASALLVTGARLAGWANAPRAISWGLARVSPELFGILWKKQQCKSPEAKRLQAVVAEGHTRRQWDRAEGPVPFTEVCDELRAICGHVLSAIKYQYCGDVTPGEMAAITAQAIALVDNVRPYPASVVARLYTGAVVPPTVAAAAERRPGETDRTYAARVQAARFYEVLGVGRRSAVGYRCVCAQEQPFAAASHQTPDAATENAQTAGGGGGGRAEGGARN